MISLNTYTLGQVEWALWHWITEWGSARAKPSSVFRTRIRRLIELDRMRRRERDQATAVRFAFQDQAPRGSGVEVRYTSFNAFCLAVGLDLLDIGFKQAEIVYLLRHLRGRLRREFELILCNPPSPWQVAIADRDYDGPIYMAHGIKYQDRRNYVVLTKIELTEIISGRAKPRKLPLIEEPRFCQGVEGLCQELHEGSPEHYRKSVIVELSYTAALVTKFLAEAPERRRGPH